MIIIDSSGWLEYFLDGPLADAYAEYVEGEEPILVPAVVVYEVYETLRRQIPEESADEAALQLARHAVVALDGETALVAAEVSLARSLPFADAVIYAIAELSGATIVTSDSHFEGLPAARYLRKA